MSTLFVDNLTVLDFSYLHPKRGMIGESWAVDLELSGELDEQGMVFDFGHIKKQVKQVLDDCADHKLLVPSDSDALEHTRDGDRLAVTWRYGGGEISLRAPHSSILFVPGVELSKGNLTLFLLDQLRPALPANVTEIVITLREEDVGTAPFYHYSHGLKKHDGNCQRIAHGHRSRIEIHENGRRSRYWEKLWADRWQDIYIGSADDLEGTYYLDDIPHHRFRYEAEQGLFELLIPEDHCYMIDTESTVENLAQHIADQLAIEAPGKHFRVKAYEGISKGALADAGQVRV